MLLMYAIPNCDTVKKARTFLEQHGIAYEFIDFKKTKLNESQIKQWSDFAGELPVNKRGTTYRKYKDTYETLTPAEKIAFIIANTSMIKRPILEHNGIVIAVSFNEKQYKELFEEFGR